MKNNPNLSRTMTNKRIILNNNIYYEKYKDKWTEIFNLVKKYNKEIGITI